MADLTQKQKEEIVLHLATRGRRSDLQKHFKQAYGIDLSPQAISAYNPNTVAGERLSSDLKQLFERTRAQYEAERGEIPITSETYRLGVLQELLENPRVRESAKQTIAVLELYAKLDGGMFDRYAQKTDVPAEAVADLLGRFEASVKSHVQDPDARKAISADIKELADRVRG